MLELLRENNDRFAYSMEDLEHFKGEPMSIGVVSEGRVYRPLHKLGEKEWEFVEK